jgi:hypothetical protein
MTRESVKGLRASSLLLTAQLLLPVPLGRYVEIPDVSIKIS